MISSATDEQWSFAHRLIFRFFFLYLVYWLAPWGWLTDVPGMPFINDIYLRATGFLVTTANRLVFHLKDELVPYGGSGDTSFGWAETYFALLLSVVGCVIWTLADRKRPNYVRLNYWLCLFTRYCVAMVALSYGIIKLFLLQMPYPSLSQLATPLGDYLPMRFAWMFVGYSNTYQFFSGFMEVLTGLLLLYRRTTTLGVMLGMVVFANIFIMNMSYDIPVKIYSFHLLLMCIFLLTNEWKRISCFFIYNRAAEPCSIYHFRWKTRPFRMARVILKAGFVFLFIVLPVIRAYEAYKSELADHSIFPLAKGIYAVEVFAVNGDTLPVPVYENERWQDLIFDKYGEGSMRTTDTSFPIRYNRAHFNYKTDTAARVIELMSGMDSVPVIRFNYQPVDTASLELTAIRGKDSIQMLIRRMPRHFQLAENQFHWMTEYIR